MLIPMYCAHMYTPIMTMNICVKVMSFFAISAEPTTSTTIMKREGRSKERPCPMAERRVLLIVSRSVGFIASVT